MGQGQLASIGSGRSTSQPSNTTRWSSDSQSSTQRSGLVHRVLLGMGWKSGHGVVQSAAATGASGGGVALPASGGVALPTSGGGAGLGWGADPPGGPLRGPQAAKQMVATKHNTG